MSTKGEENTDIIIEACQAALTTLEDPKPEWKEALESTVSGLTELKAKFFLKTNLAVPITNTCRKDAEELQGLVEKQDADAFDAVLARFKANIQNLLDQSNMDGLVLT